MRAGADLYGELNGATGQLERDEVKLNHLMESNQPVAKARSAVRCGASDKLRNAGDGLIWPTEGRLLASAELRCGPLVVGHRPRREPRLVSRRQKPVK